MADAILKTCATCKVAHELPRFGVHRRQADGLRRSCKDCEKAIARRSYLKHQEARKAVAIGRAAAWRAVPGNAQRNRERALKWYHTNPENQANAKARAKNWGELHKQQRDETGRQYREKNKPRRNAHTRTYKARRLNATPAWANFERIADFYEEAARLSIESGQSFEVDHVVPLQSETVCGLHVESNLMVIPAVLNRAKGNRYWPDMP